MWDLISDVSIGKMVKVTVDVYVFQLWQVEEADAEH